MLRVRAASSKDKTPLFWKLWGGVVCLFVVGGIRFSGKLAPVFSGVIKMGIIFIGNPLE